MTIVLLPGMDGTGILFEPFVAAMAAKARGLDVRVVSYPSGVPMSYSELEAIARAALPSEGPFVILGESYSGPIAIALAQSAPARLKGIVLCCTFARNPRPALNLVRPLLHLIPAGSVPQLSLNYFLLGRFATPALTNLIAQAVARASPAVRRARLRELLTIDVSKALVSVDLPILCLRALHDRVVPAREARYIASLNPRVRTVEVDAPHMLLQTVPDEAVRIIREFVDEVGGKTR